MEGGGVKLEEIGRRRKLVGKIGEVTGKEKDRERKRRKRIEKKAEELRIRNRVGEEKVRGRKMIGGEERG